MGVRIKITVNLVLALMLLASPKSIHASDPGQSGWATFIGTNPMSLQWNIEIETILKTSLVNSNGIVTVAVSGGYDIICIDNATGNILWKTRSANQLSGVPEISATRGLVIASTRLGEIAAYSIKTGEKIYTASTGWDESTSPTLSETKLLAKGLDRNKGRSGIIAVNIDTGKVAWITSAAPSSQPPCSIDGTVYVCERQAVKAVRESDGMLIWRNELPFNPDFISCRGKVLAVTSGTDIHFLSQDNGRVERTKSFDSKIIMPPTFHGGICHIVTKDGYRLSTFDIDTSADLWSTESDSELFQPQVWNNGLMVSSQKCVQFVDRITGKLLWDVTAIGSITANPIAVIDYLIIPTSLKLHAFRNAGFEIQVVADSIDLGLLTADQPFGTGRLQVFNQSGSIQKIFCQTTSPWLKVAPDSFEIMPHDSIELQLTADMRQEQMGIHSSKVSITWSAGFKELAIEAKKVTPDEAKPLKPGFVATDRQSIDMSARLGQPNPSFSIQVSNTGDREIDLAMLADSKWIKLTQIPQSLRGRESRTVYGFLLTSKSSMGKNDGVIRIMSKESGQMVEIPVTFWRDPGTIKVLTSFELGNSVALINGVKVRARPEPFEDNKQVMISLNFAQLILDCQAVNAGNGIWKLTRGDRSVIFTLDSDFAEYFSPSRMERVRLASPATIKKNCVVIPLEVLRLAFDGKFSKSGKQGTLELDLEEL